MKDFSLGTSPSRKCSQPSLQVPGLRELPPPSSAEYVGTQAPVAQGIEHWPPKPGVARSNRAGRASFFVAAQSSGTWSEVGLDWRNGNRRCRRGAALVYFLACHSKARWARMKAALSMSLTHEVVRKTEDSARDHPSNLQHNVKVPKRVSLP